MRSAFVTDLRTWLEDFGVLLVQLDRGGFALVAISSLEGAPTILSKNYVFEERQMLKAGNLDEDKLLDELESQMKMLKLRPTSK